MKRFWLVLLSLGLVMAFSAQAFAVDVKFSGSFYAAGMYVDKTNLNGSPAATAPSTAFYFQRLRLATEFIVSPGLSVITRADIMERAWGANRSAPGTTAGTNSMGTTAENENIAFDYAYASYTTPIGTFQAGSRPAGFWGTVFGDSTTPAFRVVYLSPKYGDFSWIALLQKVAENSYTANNITATQSDKDNDAYFVGFTYNTKTVKADLLLGYYNYAATRTGTGADYKRKSYIVVPSVKAKIGPVAIQAELDYAFGKFKEYDNQANNDVKLNSLIYWLDATATFGPVYFGGTFAYAQGQGTDPTVQNLSLTGGTDWSPTLIMWNEDRALWLGSLSSSAAATGFGASMSNAYLYQIRGGVKPAEKMDIMASVTFATADTTPAGYVSKNYGYEIDVTGTYKITNNLSYMLGVGYLFTGNYFKGTNDAASVNNDYIVTNKLTLTF